MDVAVAAGAAAAASVDDSLVPFFKYTDVVSIGFAFPNGFYFQHFPNSLKFSSRIKAS